MYPRGFIDFIVVKWPLCLTCLRQLSVAVLHCTASQCTEWVGVEGECSGVEYSHKFVAELSL
jgi:hypothetical protein